MVTSPVRTQGFSRLEVMPRRQQTSSTSVSLGSRSLTLPTTALFGTDGIRGRVGDLLNADLALQVGFWAGQVLQTQTPELGPVIVGQDSRNSSDMLAMALTAGLTAAGLEVWNLGLCPTPGIAYLTRMTDAIGGVMISASHNPPEDNGIKFFASEGTKLPVALQKQIEAGLRGFSGEAIPADVQGQHYYRAPGGGWLGWGCGVGG
jgi:phosphoglucosamine mutase